MTAQERIRLVRRAGAGHVDAILELAAEAKRAGESEARLLKVLREAEELVDDARLLAGWTGYQASEKRFGRGLDSICAAIAAAEVGP